MNLRHIILIVFLGITLLLGCNNNYTTNPNDKKQVEVILKAKAFDENKTFYKKDSLAWGNFFLHSPSVYWVCVENDVTLRATGWEDLSKFVSNWMKENPVPESDSLLKLSLIEDFNLELDHELAFVSFKKNQMMQNGVRQITLENRVFKLENSDWKILGMTSAPGYQTTNSSKNVFIHNDKK